MPAACSIPLIGGEAWPRPHLYLLPRVRSFALLVSSSTQTFPFVVSTRRKFPFVCAANRLYDLHCKKKMNALDLIRTVAGGGGRRVNP